MEWKDDKNDHSVAHLSQSDKRLLFYGAFMICMLTLIISSLGDLGVSKKNSEGMEKIVGMVATYIGSATDSEYEDVAKSLRHDLVFSEYGQEIVSVQKMKAIFCDECIRKLLNAVENQPMKEFVIYDSKKRSFHPIALGKDLQIGNYSLEIEFKDGYEITVKYIEE